MAERTGVLNDLKALASVASEDLDRKNVGLVAAGIAFFAMFSVFPGVGALIALFGLIADPTIVAEQVLLLRDIVPADAFDIVAGQVDALLKARPDALGVASILSIVTALWFARMAVAALMQALNSIADQPNRKGLRQAMVSVLLTLSLIGVAGVALLMVIVAPILLAFAPLGPLEALAAEALRWGIAIFVLIFALGIVYRFGPNRRGNRLRWFTAGAFLAIALWLAASVMFSYYLTNFGNYNEVFGSLGAVAALLMWFYISAYVVLLGAVVNRAIERVRALRPKGREHAGT